MSPCMAQLSPECRDLLSRIFHIAEADRITIQQIMQHPWCLPAARCAAGAAVHRARFALPGLHVEAVLRACCNSLEHHVCRVLII